MTSSSSVNICIEELLARKTVNHGDQFSTVTIPGLSTLSAADRRTLCARLVSELDTPHLDLDAVNTMLENFSREPSITPPPGSDIARVRELEQQSRKALLDAGCPSCYPLVLELPLQNVPERYEVVSYWQSLEGTGRLVLTAQLSNWRAFCEFQDRTRQYYLKRGAFPNFVDDARDRRRRHGLEGDVHLLPDPKQQSRLGNWIEFQNYHLMLYEREEMEVEGERKKWDAARNESERPGLEDVRHLDFLKKKMKYSEGRLEEHEKMLRWIEQQRKAMVAEQTASVYATECHELSKSMFISTSLGGRKRNQGPRSLISPVRSAVIKSPKRRTLRPSKRNESHSATNATANPNTSRRRRRIPEPEVRSSRRGEESIPLSPFNPQKVVKITKKGCKGKIWGNNKAKPQKAGLSNYQKQVQECAAVVVTTRSGRKIKRPEWFRPG